MKLNVLWSWFHESVGESVDGGVLLLGLGLLGLELSAHGGRQALSDVDVVVAEGAIHRVGQLRQVGGVVAAAPVEGREVDAGQPVDNLGQDEDGAEGDDDDGDEVGRVEVEVEEVAEAAPVEKVGQAGEGDGEEGHGEGQAQLDVLRGRGGEAEVLAGQGLGGVLRAVVVDVVVLVGAVADRTRDGAIAGATGGTGNEGALVGVGRSWRGELLLLSNARISKYTPH